MAASLVAGILLTPAIGKAQTAPAASPFTVITVGEDLPAGSQSTGFQLTSTAGGKATGIWIDALLGTHPIVYDLSTNQWNWLPNPGGASSPLGTDGINHVGYVVLPGANSSLPPQAHCIVWTEGPSGIQTVVDPLVQILGRFLTFLGQSWCTSIDNGVTAGTTYDQTFLKFATGQNSGTEEVTQHETAWLGDIATPTAALSDLVCCTIVRGSRGGVQAGQVSETAPVFTVVTPVFDPVVGNPIDSSPAKNPFAHAAAWFGTAASMVDLHPAGYSSSSALATDGVRQGGWISLDGKATTAALWSGTAASLVQMSAPGYVDTRVSGMSTLFAVGDGWLGGPANAPGATRHGLLWHRDGSVEDLNQYLPAGYTHLTITGADADGTIVGYAQQTFNGVPTVVNEIGILLVPTPGASLATLTLNSSTPTAGDTITGTLTLRGPAVPGGVLVSVTSSNPTLVAAPLPVLIPEGQTSATFTVSANADTFLIAPSTVTLSAQAAYTGASATLTVLPRTPDDAIASLTLAPAVVAPGGSVTAVVTLTAPAHAGGESVAFASPNAGALADLPGHIVIPEGQMSGSFPVTTTPNSFCCSNLPKAVVLSAATGNVVQQATLTIEPDLQINDVHFVNALGGFNPGPLTGGTSADFVVGFNVALPFPVTTPIALTSTNPAVIVPANVLGFSAGGTYTATVLPVPELTTGVVTATANGSSFSTTISVSPSPQPTIQSVAIPFVSTGQTFTGTIALSGPALLGGATLSLVSSAPAVAAVPATITIPFGASSATFTGVAGPVAGPTTVTITASFNGATTAGTLTVIPKILAITGYTLSPYSAIGPGIVTTGTITLNQPAPAGGVTIALSASDLKPAKFPSSVTFAQGQISANVTVQGNSVSGPATTTLTASYAGVLAPAGTSTSATLTVMPTDTLHVTSATWSKSTQLLTITATSTNPQAIVAVLNANGNVPLGTMTNLGGGGYSFQTTLASIASVNIKSNLGGSTGQGVSVIP
ncbi:MAG: hypothetical protein LAO77_10025 [Acidobacteriia bacterium]|nr:hypothetical protein [Terriglobia bacterium]